MRALIVGAGSVGGYFGGRLAAAGRDVTFLVRPRRADQLADGLTIISKGEETRVRAKVITTGKPAGSSISSFWQSRPISWMPRSGTSAAMSLRGA
jgi:2-dehydropantoate 2-reductase